MVGHANSIHLATIMHDYWDKELYPAKGLALVSTQTGPVDHDLSVYPSASNNTPAYALIVLSGVGAAGSGPTKFGLVLLPGIKLYQSVVLSISQCSCHVYSTEVEGGPAMCCIQEALLSDPMVCVCEVSIGIPLAAVRPRMIFQLSPPM